MQRSKYWGALALFVALAGLPALAWAELPAGYRLAQKLATEDGSVLQVLEDQRISAQLHKDSWGNGLDEDSFDEPGDLVENPLLEAQVRLVSASGDVIAHEDLGYPLAELKKAPLKGLPQPVYFLTIDQTAPMGSYSGPATQLLMPHTTPQTNGFQRHRWQGQATDPGPDRQGGVASCDARRWRRG